MVRDQHGCKLKQQYYCKPTHTKTYTCKSDRINSRARCALEVVTLYHMQDSLPTRLGHVNVHCAKQDCMQDGNPLPHARLTATGSTVAHMVPNRIAWEMVTLYHMQDSLPLGQQPRTHARTHMVSAWEMVTLYRTQDSPPLGQQLASCAQGASMGDGDPLPHARLTATGSTAAHIVPNRIAQLRGRW
jgi:hypothetical protein